MTEQKIIKTHNHELLQKAEDYKTSGWKLIQICSTKTAEGFELSYCFAREQEFETLRIELPQNEEVTSISAVYAPAFLYENEMKDLFGVKITNISLDYNGAFYRTVVKTPYNPGDKSGGAEPEAPACER